MSDRDGPEWMEILFEGIICCNRQIQNNRGGGGGRGRGVGLPLKFLDHLIPPNPLKNT